MCQKEREQLLKWYDPLGSYSEEEFLNSLRNRDEKMEPEPRSRIEEFIEKIKRKKFL